MLSMFKNMRYGVLSVSVLAILVCLICIPQLFENLDASEIMVIQSPLSGDLTVYTEPGYKWQAFGKVTKYPRQKQYSFCSRFEVNSANRAVIEIKCDDASAISKRLRFNDGGHANLNGSINWEMPLDAASVINIHKKFGSAEGVEQRAVEKMIDAAVYLAGPLMSSTESSGSRRSELVQFIDDQAENGVYVTTAKIVNAKDAAGNDVTEKVTEIVMDEKGMPKRQQGSILSQFNIKLLPMSISELKYDNIVEGQIAQRQKSTTEVQISRANAARAEQDAITAEAEGKAKAATAKWTQETINAKEIALAQKDLQVAQLAAQTAAQEKIKLTLEGEGEAAKKRLVMAADGALDKKLEAYVATQQAWSAAFKDHKGTMVPQVMMGGAGAGGSGVSSTQQMMELLSIKAARDLGLDLQASGAGLTGKK